MTTHAKWNGAIVWMTAIACVAAAAVIAAQTTRTVTFYNATTMNLGAADGRSVQIEMFGWSSDADRDALAKAFGESGEKVAQALSAKPAVGYFWLDRNTVGYSVRYAYRASLPGGGERIVLVTERPVGSLERNPWRAANVTPAPPDYPFTLVEIRVNNRGIGEGKMSMGAPIVVDPELKGVALSGYATAPVLLKDVRRVGNPAPAGRPTSG